MVHAWGVDFPAEVSWQGQQSLHEPAVRLLKGSEFGGGGQKAFPMRERAMSVVESLRNPSNCEGGQTCVYVLIKKVFKWIFLKLGALGVKGTC